MKANNLEGKQIGKWKVGSLVKKNGKLYFQCTCECGTVSLIRSSVLNTGKSNGCIKCAKTGSGESLLHQWFGILYTEEALVINHHTYYRCSCKCGGSTIVDAHKLRGGQVTTCGCRTGVAEKIKESLTPYCVNGTYIPGLHRKGVNKNNTSGRTGVGFRPDRNKWRAYIKFQRKNIHLGNFDRYEDAVAARLIAEKEFFGKYLEK